MIDEIVSDAEVLDEKITYFSSNRTLQVTHWTRKHSFARSHSGQLLRHLIATQPSCYGYCQRCTNNQHQPVGKVNDTGH